jgi:hypothetical protein
MKIISTVRKSRVPDQALAWQALPNAHYADAYCVEIGATEEATIDDFAHAIFDEPAGWISTLMNLRDRIVSLFGLKTAKDLRRERSPDRLGMFKVFSRTENELLVGEDDRHLDFRISVLCSRSGETSQVCLVTVVKTKNIVGRLYLFPVKYVHRIVVRSMLRRLACRSTAAMLATKKNR